jgi:ureidoglycolate lyase
MQKLYVPITSLTRESFHPFGDVIETEGAEHFETNAGYAERFHDLARIECTADGGRPLLSIFRAKPFPLPLRIELMERHPISSQAFVPMDKAVFLVVVGERSTKPEPADLRAFVTNGRQGINYRPGTWHHPLTTFTAADFLVVDRKGPGEGHDQDYDEIRFANWEILVDTNR